MGKNKFFVPLLTFGMLLSALVACGSNNSESRNPSKGGSEPSASASTSAGGDSTSKSSSSSSSSSKSSSSSSKASSSSSSSSSQQQQVHVHDYTGNPKATYLNSDEKVVRLYDCKDNDEGKVMAIAFADYSEKSADFGSTSGYNNVPQELRNSSFLIAKNATVTWKVNVDKAITGAKLSFGVVYTGSDHNTQTGSDGGTVKYSFKVNDGSFVDWGMGSNTYEGCGLSQSARKDYVFGSIDLVAGENTITVRQNNAGYRLLFGGDVKIAYDGDALPVSIPEKGYDITFAPAEHCKVLVYLGKKETVEANKAQSVNADATDPETNRFVPSKYHAAVEDNPDTADVDETVKEIKPEIMFKLQFDDGYTADGNDITISGTMGNEWNKLCTYDDDNSYNITKIKAAITVTIAVRAVTGEEPAGYVGTFNIDHGTIVVYQGKKNGAGDNVDTPDANGKYLSRVSKGGAVSKTKAQFNFDIIPDPGYEFVSGFTAAELDDGLSPVNVEYITGHFGNFKCDPETNVYSLTKVASSVVVNIVCTPIAAQA